ncbi:MAG: permease [Peptococcaceae bacterium]
MTSSIILLTVLAVLAFSFAYKKGDGSHRKGLQISYKTLVNMFPLLMIAFLMAGFLQVVIPPGLIQSWLGEEAGLKGVLIGSIGGALIPGGPYVAFPIIAAIFKAGAGLGTAVSFIVAWAMYSIGTIPFELALIGPRFTMLRLSLVVLLPLLSGFIAYLL